MVERDRQGDEAGEGADARRVAEGVGQPAAAAGVAGVARPRLRAEGDHAQAGCEAAAADARALPKQRACDRAHAAGPHGGRRTDGGWSSRWARAASRAAPRHDRSGHDARTAGRAREAFGTRAVEPSRSAAALRELQLGQAAFDHAGGARAGRAVGVWSARRCDRAGEQVGSRRLQCARFTRRAARGGLPRRGRQARRGGRWADHGAGGGWSGEPDGRIHAAVRSIDGGGWGRGSSTASAVCRRRHGRFRRPDGGAGRRGAAGRLPRRSSPKLDLCRFCRQAADGGGACHVARRAARASRALRTPGRCR